MERNELIQLITRRVAEKLGSPAPNSVQTEGSGCSTNTGPGSCETGRCPVAWDGIGTISDMLAAGANRLSSFPPFGSCPDRAMAQLIDHTLLKPEATEQDIIQLCEEAASNCFMSVCINPVWVERAYKILHGSGVRVCTVIGFPLGATFSRVKELETRIAIDDGAGEVDMVINVGALKSGNLRLVEEDIRSVVRAARGNVITKVILETCFLTGDEIKTACEISARAGANFVKTSTGFGKGGATIENIKLMRQTVGGGMGVKASGGIRDHDTAMDLVSAGASRIGASASVAIVECQKPSGKGY